MNIRDSMAPDIGGIGKKIERQPEKVPAILRPIPSNPNVLRRDDGKLETFIPENEKAGWKSIQPNPLAEYWKCVCGNTGNTGKP